MSTLLALGLVLVLSGVQTATLAAAAAHPLGLESVWSDEFDHPEGWQEEAARAGISTSRQSFTVANGHGDFRVSGPHMEARWRKTTEPIWLSEYRFFAFRYRATGVAPRMGLVVALRPGSVGPVTPGASNPENPFAKGANLEAVDAHELVQDGAWHIFVRDLTRELATPQIDQITVQVTADDLGNAGLEVDYIRFLKSDPRQSLSDFLPITPSASPSCALPGCDPKSLKAISLQSVANTPASRALSELGVPAGWLPSQWLTFAGLPFANGKVAATTMQGREVITLPVQGRASEVYLLLGASFTGIGDTPNAAEAGGVDTGKAPIRSLREPDRVAVCVEYSNGMVDEFFPFNILRHEFVIQNRSLSVYILPADPHRTISRLELHDRMSNGAFLLFGATVNSGRPLYPGINWSGSSVPKSPEARNLPAHRPELQRSGDQITLENTYYRYVFSTANGFSLTHVLNKFGDVDMLGGRDAEGLFACDVAALSGNLPVSRTFRMSDFHIKDLAIDRSRLTVELSSTGPTLPLEARLEAQMDESPGLQLGLLLENPGNASIQVDLAFPVLHDVRLGTADETYYLFPSSAAVLDNTDQKIEAAYSDKAPLQFLDLFNPRQNAGWGVLEKDTSLRAKVFSLAKHGDRASLSVSYSYPVDGPGDYKQAIVLGPGEKFQAPPAALFVHSGDWRPLFRAYRDWVKTWYHPLPRKEWFARVFNMRRDYPIGGTGKLFDAGKDEYTLDRLIREGNQIGGIDMIDISGWAYSPRYGRVGDYCHFFLGGLDNFRQSIAQIQSEGVPVGLYTEGYLVDLNSLVGEAHGKEWQMIDRLGGARAWPGASSEVFECPYVREWQEYMASTAARVLRETDAKAFYLDEFGFGAPEQACYGRDHGHAPGATPADGERQMMGAVRRAIDTVDPERALYIEEMPPDVNAQFVDAAFCYALNFADEGLSPGKINLYRFVFPRLKLFDMVSSGINPTAMTAEEMKLSFFNGNGLWLKGDLDSWYSPEVREFISRAHRALRDHSEAFTSDNPEPLITTLAPGVLANRFASAHETVYTFFNRGFRTFRGRVMEVPVELSNRRFVDLFTGKTVSLACQSGACSFATELGPRDVGAVAAVARE